MYLHTLTAHSTAHRLLAPSCTNVDAVAAASTPTAASVASLAVAVSAGSTTAMAVAESTRAECKETQPRTARTRSKRERSPSIDRWRDANKRRALVRQDAANRTNRLCLCTFECVCAVGRAELCAHLEPFCEFQRTILEWKTYVCV